MNFKLFIFLIDYYMTRKMDIIKKKHWFEIKILIMNEGLL